MLKKHDVINAFKDIGILPTDTLLVHSSMKSMGHVDGGPHTVIDALIEVVDKGTLVFPTLFQKERHIAYKEWDIANSPSSVGLLSETFRRMPSVVRSDNETHSVAALGVNAEYITSTHRGGKGRVGVFGSSPFSYTSPWQKMYELDAKVVMLGVTMMYNTFKHFVEYILVDEILQSLDEDTQKEATSLLQTFDYNPTCPESSYNNPDGVWFFHDGLLTQNEMQRLGLLNIGKCGDATLVGFRVKEFFAYMYNQFKTNPEKWFENNTIEWLNRYSKRG